MKWVGTTLLVPILGTVLALVVGVVALFHFQNTRTLGSVFQQEEEIRAEQVLQITRDVINAEAEKVQAMGSILASMPELKNALAEAADLGTSTPRLEGVMRGLQRQGELDQLVALDGQGQVLQQFSHHSDLNEKQLPWGLGEALDGAKVLTVSAGSGKLAIQALEPIYAHGEVVGVILIGQAVDADFARRIKALIGWDVAICSRGNILASSFDPGQNRMIHSDLLQAVFYEKKRQIDDKSGDHRTVYYELINLVDETFGLVLVADGTESARFLVARQQQAARMTILVLGVAMVLSLAFSIWLVRPLRALRRRSDAIARELAGSSLESGQGGGNEIGALVRSFTHMEASLRSHRDQRESIERALKSAKEKAEEASRAKSDFLSTMSHEIRTPMTAILGFTDLLKNPENSTEENLDFIRIIQNNGNHLLAIINDILDLSKVESGQMEMEMKPFSPVSLAEEVISLLGVRAAEKGISLRSEPIFPLPATMVSDNLRVRQILLNLVGNAIKFTEEGCVTLRIDLPEPGNPRLIRFTVIDTGMGMDEGQMERLFQAFCQGDASTSRRFGGTGLGLTISRSLARMLGGDISAESNPGQGSEFAVLLASGCTESDSMLESWDGERDAAVQAQEVLPLNELRGLRVLLAEDNKFNQRLAKLVLKDAGLLVSVVENGREAVDRVVAEADKGQPFDLVLMDVMMPEMDGLQATSELRRLGHHLPIIALTANAMQEDRQRCLDAGCDGFSTKPFRKVELLQTIAEQVMTTDAQG
jgi:signal transduction histidine kinase/ActR/RegA family two-component response regulator